MPWFQSSDGKSQYWIPEIIPEPTSEWNSSQRIKRYFDPNLKTVKIHPTWYFDNGALVNDEYLLINEGWLLVIDNYPENLESSQIAKTNPQEDWIYEENAVNVTYSIHTYVDPGPPKIKYNETYTYNSENEWISDENLKTITKTLTVTNLTEDMLLMKDEQTWKDIRREREVKLLRTDYLVIMTLEKNLTLSKDILDYRQELRDIPEKIVDVRLFDLKNDSLWPIKPAKENYYA